MVPLRVGGGVHGVVMLQVHGHSRHDADLAAPRSRLVADVVADALSRKAATESLRRSRQRFLRILDTAMDGVVVVDPTGIIVEWSAQASVVFGVARESALRTLFPDLVHPDDRGALRRKVDAVAEASGQPAERFERRAVRAGVVFPLELSATRLEMSDGAVVAAFARDISDRKRAEAERQRAFDEVSRQKRSAEMERDYLREEQDDPHVVLGTSPALKSALALVEAVAEMTTVATVLLLGESGVGKECFARVVHATSRRARGPFVRVNCASIPSTLFESEFFGHAKGSFTGAHKDRIGRFELADGGTLFLDEVGEIPLELQAKLLRVLQEGEIERVGEDRTRKLDVRIVAATNRDLAQEVEAGRFRRDLYFRLGVFPIAIPPLRERGDDIVLLAEHFLARHAGKLRRTGLTLSRDDAANASRRTSGRATCAGARPRDGARRDPLAHGPAPARSRARRRGRVAAAARGHLQRAAAGRRPLERGRPPAYRAREPRRRAEPRRRSRVGAGRRRRAPRHAPVDDARPHGRRTLGIQR